MKSQYTKFERQLMHSYELSRRNSKQKQKKYDRNALILGWAIVVLWLIFTATCYICVTQ